MIRIPDLEERLRKATNETSITKIKSELEQAKKAHRNVFLGEYEDEII